MLEASDNVSVLSMSTTQISIFKYFAAQLTLLQNCLALNCRCFLIGGLEQNSFSAIQKIHSYQLNYNNTNKEYISKFLKMKLHITAHFTF